jgi:hypothetical protein
MTRIVELIYTEEFRGDGTQNDPHRRCPQLFTRNGTLVASRDDVEGPPMFYPNYIRELP